MSKRRNEILAIALGATVFVAGAILTWSLTRPATTEIEPSAASVDADNGTESSTIIDPAQSQPESESASNEAQTIDMFGRSEGDNSAPTALVASQPKDGESGVGLQPSFRLQFDQSLDPSTVDTALYTIADAFAEETTAIDAASITLDLTRNNLSFSSVTALAPQTDYLLTVDGLEAEGGIALGQVSVGFTTGEPATASDRFTQTMLAAINGPTSIVAEAGGSLLVSTFNGDVVRLESATDGESIPPSTIVSNPSYHMIGMAIDPDDPQTLWISQWSKQPTDEFGAEIVTYDLSTGVGTKRVVGLPRHPNGDHSVQSLAFHQGKLYASVGSMTTSGNESFSFWGDPILREIPVSASIVEIDYTSLGAPSTVRDSVITADSAPVRLFATGLRNAYDLAWHSNGNLYANINQNGGSDEQSTRTPTDGACEGLPSSVATNTLNDTLNLIRRGGYYGHPNPSRGECVVMGGGQGAFAVAGYDKSQAPEPAFNPALITPYASSTGGSFGISVNGLAEYLGGGPLAGSLLSADFSGSRTILTAKPASANDMSLAEPIGQLADTSGAPLTFIHPLDVVSTSSGEVYVADFGEWPGNNIGGQGAIYRLRPTP